MARRFRYEDTHLSAHDGSPAQLVTQDAETMTLRNECGDVWTDPIGDWLPVDVWLATFPNGIE